MYDSPSNGGRSGSTWVDAPEQVSRGKVTSAGQVPDWIYYDSITIAAELPTPHIHTLDFEVTNDVPDYDSVGLVRPGIFIPAHDNPLMDGFVDQWEAVTTATAAFSGSQAARFTNPPAPWKSLAFDLTGARPGTSVSLWFYDNAGQVSDRDNSKAASVIIEEGSNPANYHAVEITNLPYPYGGVPLTYYLVEGSAENGGEATLYSKGLGARSVGWHHIEIGLYDTYSEIMVDGVVARYTASGDSSPGNIARGPGLDTSPKLRILGDSSSAGGFNNYLLVDPIQASYMATREPFVWFDDISIPTENASVGDWMNY
jgi:hypothetical protein